MRAYERLLNYVKVYTTSDPVSDTHPTTARQFDLARMLVKELQDLGLADAHVDEHCYVYATLPATPGHEAAKLQRANWDDLLPNRLFVRERGSGTRAVLDHVLAANNLSVDDFARMTEVESINIIKTLVGDGLGIAFLYEAAVADELARGSLVRIDLAGAPIEHDITFVCHKDGVLRDRLRTMFAELAELYKTAARR